MRVTFFDFTVPSKNEMEHNDPGETGHGVWDSERKRETAFLFFFLLCTKSKTKS